MPYDKTTWLDKIIQNPLTFVVQNNPDGSITLIPKPGTITQLGTPVNAANLNNLETQYEKAIADIRPNIDQLDYNVYNLILQNYYDGKIVPKQGLFYDGFLDTGRLRYEFYNLVSSPTVGAKTINVSGDASEIAVGDVYVLSSPTGYESVKVAAINSGVITTVDQIQFSHDSGTVLSKTTAAIDPPNKRLTFSSNGAFINAGTFPGNNVVPVGYDTSSDWGKGQTLVLSRDTIVSQITVNLQRTSTAPGDAIQMTLHEGANAPIKATSSNTIQGSSLSSAFQEEHTFTFNPPVVLKKGTNAFRLNRTGGVSTSTYYYVGTNTGPNAGGSEYKVTQANTWSPDGSAAIGFKLYEIPKNLLATSMFSNKFVSLSPITSAKLWITRTNIAGSTIYPQISVVESSLRESYQDMILERSIDNLDGTFEDTYSWVGEPGTDIIFKALMTRNSLTDDVFIKKYGLAVGV